MSATAGNDKLGVAMFVMAFPPKSIGGAEIQCLRLSRRLVASGIPVHVFTEGGPGIPRFERMEGIAVHRLSCWSGETMMMVLDGVARWRRGKSPKTNGRSDGLPYDPTDPGIQFRNPVREMVRYMLFFVNGIPALWRCRRGLGLIHVHIVPWMSFVGTLLGRLFRLPVVVKESTVTGARTVCQLPFGRMMLKYVRNRCTFIAMTEAIRRALVAEGISESRVVMIPNGVEVVTDLKVEREPYTCLTVGNLTQGAAKGFDILFRSWVRVIQELPQAKLWIAGSGDPSVFGPYLQHLGIGEGVEFLGPVQDPRLLYHSSAVVAFPSRREGMSNALLEAMASASPIVATRVSGAEDLLQPGVNGILVETEDAAGLAAGILELFLEPEKARAYGARARATVLQACQMDHVVRKYLALYSRLMVPHVRDTFDP